MNLGIKLLAFGSTALLLIVALHCAGVPDDLLSAIGTVLAFVGFAVTTIHESARTNRHRIVQLELEQRARFIEVAKLRLDTIETLSPSEKSTVIDQVQQAWEESKKIYQDEVMNCALGK
ncbi:MAG: hypothetical protein J0M24_10845 [Verrucomicrobia bacterium]|nr:hypothetical protein [Verrucomicrobiota bacterium]